MSNLSLRYKILIIATIIIATLLGLGYFVILPSRSAIIKAKNIIENKRQSLEQKYTRGQDISLLTKNIEKISAEAKNLNKIFVIQGQELNFITTLEKVAQENQILQTIRMSPPQNNEASGKTMTKLTKQKINYQASELQLSVSGNFAQLIKYLNDLEKLDYLVNIISVDISQQEKINPLQPINKNQTIKNVDATIYAIIYFINEKNLL